MIILTGFQNQCILQWDIAPIFTVFAKTLVQIYTSISN